MLVFGSASSDDVAERVPLLLLQHILLLFFILFAIGLLIIVVLLIVCVFVFIFFIDFAVLFLRSRASGRNRLLWLRLWLGLDYFYRLN